MKLSIKLREWKGRQTQDQDQQGALLLDSAQELMNKDVHVDEVVILYDLKLIGMGVGGAAYKWRDRVIKIAEDDYGYQQFVHFVLNRESPHLPVMYDYRFVGKSGTAVIMEHLQEVEAVKILTMMDPWTRSIMSYIFRAHDTGEMDLDLPNDGNPFYDLSQRMRTQNSIELTSAYLRAYGDKSPIMNLLMGLHNRFFGDLRLDLSAPNWMARGRTLVITDPLV